MPREAKRLERRLARQVADACARYELLAPNDRVLVALSGGKDSFTMLHTLRQHVRSLSFPVSLVAVHLDQRQPGYDGTSLVAWLEASGVEYEVLSEDTYSVVTSKLESGQTYCSLCSRLRRGILYRVAKEKGCTKIALGHHRDDILQTLLLNLFFAGQLAAMPPKLMAQDGHVVIRPLAYCAEEDIKAYAEAKAFPILPCDLCGSQDNLQRKIVGQMINDLEAKHPDIKAVMLAATQNVRPSHLLDKGLWQKLGLEAAREEESNGLVGASRLLRDTRAAGSVEG